MIRFINRRRELDFLKRKFDASGSQFVVIYGRRRVGKTELIKQFCNDKNALYFLADRRGTLLNLERFAEKAADHFNDIPPRVGDFYDLFRYLVRHTGSKRYVTLTPYHFREYVQPKPLIQIPNLLWNLSYHTTIPQIDMIDLAILK